MKRASKGILGIMVGLLFLTGCSSEMSKEQEADITANKLLIKAVSELKDAKNVHITLVNADKEFKDINTGEGKEVYDVNISGDDFAGTHKFTNLEGNEEVDYIYKRGSYEVTYISEMKNAYNLYSSKIFVELMNEVKNMPTTEVSDEVMDNYQQRYEIKDDKNGTITYKLLGYTSTNMKQEPQIKLSPDNKIVGYTGFNGVSITIDGMNTSPLDYKYADCIEGKCMNIDL